MISHLISPSSLRPLMTAVSLVRRILAMPKTTTGVCSCRTRSALAKDTSFIAFRAPNSPGVFAFGATEFRFRLFHFSPLSIRVGLKMRIQIGRNFY